MVAGRCVTINHETFWTPFQVISSDLPNSSLYGFGGVTFALCLSCEQG